MLARLKLASQFTLLLSLIFIGGISLGGFALSQALEQRALREMSDRGQMLMHIGNSVSNYTSNDIATLISQLADSQPEFIPETIPSIATKRVFDKLKANWKYKDLIYKQATLNPTNLDDQADRFEAKLIERFESDRTLKSLADFRSQAGERLFYSAQPLAVTSPNCLKCHGSPDIAPKSHVKQYGTQNGYGWKLNQVVGTEIIYIPAREVFQNARQALWLFISIFMGIFALVIVSINYLLKWRVIQPLKPMAQLAQIMSLDTVSADEVRELERQGLTKIAQRRDELRHLGRMFQTMVHEVCDHQQQLSKQLQQLQIKIDQTTLIQEVAEITESDYWGKLQQTAKQIREEATKKDQINS